MLKYRFILSLFVAGFSLALAATPTYEDFKFKPVYCDPSEAFCLSSATDGKGNIGIKLVAKTAGWVAMGIGSSMSNADIYVGYVGTKGQPIISDRKTGSGHDAPSVDSIQNAFILSDPLGGMDKNGTSMTITFWRPLNSSDTSNDHSIADKIMDFIFAISDTPPTSSTRDSYSAPISQHSYVGGFSANLVLGDGGTTLGVNEVILNNVNRDQVKVAHGVMMFLAWGVFAFIGIFTARFLKDKLDHKWYLIHRGSFIIASSLTLISFILIILVTPLPHFDTEDGIHKPLGFIVMLMTFLQVPLGFYCNYAWSPSRVEIPWWDKLHWWNGRILTLLALINIYIGLVLYGSSLGWKIMYWIYILLVILGIFGLGQYRYGQVHHMNGKVGDNHNSSNNYYNMSKSHDGQSQFKIPRQASLQRYGREEGVKYQYDNRAY